MANWINLYSFENNEERTVKILKKFGIENYHFAINNGSLALLINVGLNSYKLEIDEYNQELVVRKKIYKRREQKHTKEYMRIVNSFKNDCLYLAIKFVCEDSKL